MKQLSAEFTYACGISMQTNLSSVLAVEIVLGYLNQVIFSADTPVSLQIRLVLDIIVVKILLYAYTKQIFGIFVIF